MVRLLRPLGSGAVNHLSDTTAGSLTLVIQAMGSENK